MANILLDSPGIDSGETVYFLLERKSDRYILDYDDNTWKANKAACTDFKWPATEDTDSGDADQSTYYAAVNGDYLNSGASSIPVLAFAYYDKVTDELASSGELWVASSAEVSVEAMRGTDSASLAADLSTHNTALSTHDTALGTHDTALGTHDTDITALIGALNDISAAEVNAQMVDVIWTDTTTEPASVPATTVAIGDKIDWIFTLCRNKMMQTATTQTLRNDVDGADIATATVSDDNTTFIRNEWS